MRNNRDELEVNQALNNLINGAKNNSGNLLDLSIKASRKRATVGEISDALEVAFGCS